MKTKLLAMMLLAGGAAFAAPAFRFVISVGGPAPSAYAAIPPCPGPGYVWVDGFWSQNFGQSAWVPGFWQFQGVNYGSYYRVAPRVVNHVGDRDDHRDNHRDFDRGSEANHSRGVEQSRNFSGQPQNHRGR